MLFKFNELVPLILKLIKMKLVVLRIINYFMKNYVDWSRYNKGVDILWNKKWILNKTKNTT